MFERYTEEARRTLFFARYEASMLGSISIQPESLLLGLLREQQSIEDLIPPESVDRLRQRLLQQTPHGQAIATGVEIPFAAGTKRILETAAREADALLHAHIGPEHLLLALSLVSETGVDAILREQGLGPAELRDKIKQRPPQAARVAPPTVPINPAAVTPEARRQGALRQLDALRAFLKGIGQEHAQTPGVQSLVEEICADLERLKAAISS